MAVIHTALISVSDKSGVARFAQRISAQGVELISTAGTARLLREQGLNVTEVSEYTGFPSILGGLVRTLHPKVLGGLLARREDEEHLRQLAEHGIRPIDMVVVNLYPFVNVIAGGGVELIQAIENIDIGGPAMVRAAAKNYTHVAVVTNPAAYDAVAEEMERNGGALSEATHYSLAVEAFRHTARYDTAIAEYLRGIKEQPRARPESLTLEFVKRQDLRHGENPHQTAAFYVEERLEEPSVSKAEQIGGPELSFNNILDADAGIGLVLEFDRPAAAIIKHGNPCGAACADSLHTAYRKAYLGDPDGACGSVVVLNRPLDVHTALALAQSGAGADGKAAPFFVDCLVAPQFEADALALLRERAEWAARTRLLQTGPLNWCLVDEKARDMRGVAGGLLVQDRDLLGFDRGALKVVTKAVLPPERLADLQLAWLCCKHATSSAVVLARDEAVVGIGAGQVSPLDAALVALRKAGERARGAAMASDAFLPGPDCIERVAGAGVMAVLQPGGAQADAAVVAAADHLGVAMAFTGTRHSRH